MNCKAAREFLSAYLDRELAAGDRDAVRSHLASCAECRHEEREIRALKGLLLGVSSPEPRGNFEKELLTRLREEPLVSPRGFWKWPEFRLQTAAFGGLVAATGLALFVVFGVPTGSRSTEAKISPVKAKEDYARYVEADMAYYRGDDPSYGSSVLMSANYEP